MAEQWLDSIAWDRHGQVAALTLHADTGEVLRHDRLNRQALILTVARGQAVYCRPQSGEAWQPDAAGGGPLRLVEVRTDAERAALMLRVRPEGRPIQGCFGWRLSEANWLPDPAPPQAVLGDRQ